MVAAVLIAYVAPLLVLLCPVLLVRRRRELLAPWEHSVVLYPALALAILFATGARRKGMTNVDVELLVLAVVVAGLVYLRVGFRRIAGSRRRVLFLPAAACGAVVGIFCATPPFRHFDLVEGWLYVRAHPEASAPIRSAILRGVIVEGMSDSEASAAGGPSLWLTENGKLARLSFNNLSQFGGDHATAFNAYFVDGMSAKTLPRTPTSPIQRFLVTLTNVTDRDLVVSFVNERDDWIRSSYVACGTQGLGWGSNNHDGARNGDRVCPQVEYALVVPSEGSVSRLLDVDVPLDDEPCTSATLDVRILTLPSSLECGPALWIERTLEVAL